jgi:hypothetical protein
MKTLALQFDWETVTNRPISAITGQNEMEMSDGSPSWDALAFAVGEQAVVLTVNADTDEIIVAYTTMPEGDGWQPVAALAHFVGQSFGWSWVGTNYLGYIDSFTLAFGDVVADPLQPRVMFLCAASSLSCFELRPAQQ